MSIVKNEAKIKNPIIKAVREQLEHRAFWLYLLCDEAGKKGLNWGISLVMPFQGADFHRVRSLLKRVRQTALSV